MRIPCDYYDGRTSTRVDATLALAGARVAVEADGIPLEFGADDIYVPPRVADTPRHIRLPGNASCVVRDNDALDALQARLGHYAARRRPVVDAPHRLAQALEGRLIGVLGCLAAIAALLFAFARWGAPLVGDFLITATPREVDATVGAEVLRGVDQLLFEPSALAEPQRQAVQGAFDQASASLGVDARLEFRQGKRTGANAFALPGGIVVITDEIVALAEHDEELVAVLAHELGHVRGRHVMRQLARTSVLFVVWSAVTMDTGLGALSAVAPEHLVALGYSRDFEREADRVAFDYLHSRGIPATRLQDILQRLQRQTCADCTVPPWLSSHPPTAERVAESGP